MTRRSSEDESSLGRTAGRAGSLLAVPAAIAWAAGLPFVFPSLGPTAYLMAVRPREGSTDPPFGSAAATPSASSPG